MSDNKSQSFIEACKNRSLEIAPSLESIFVIANAVQLDRFDRGASASRSPINVTRSSLLFALGLGNSEIFEVLGRDSQAKLAEILGIPTSPRLTTRAPTGSQVDMSIDKYVLNALDAYASVHSGIPLDEYGVLYGILSTANVGYVGERL